MKFIISSLLLTLVAASETAGLRSSRRATRGPDRNGGRILDCFLVNLSREVELKLDGSNDYDPSDSSKGWSVKCFGTDGNIDYVNFFYEDQISTQYYSSERFASPLDQPFWMEGDQDGKEVNDVPYLATPGTKTFTVKFYTWPGGDDFPDDVKTYTLNGGGGCNNGGYSCPPGFTAKNSCPLGFGDCFCNNGGFQCPPGLYPTTRCPLGLNDCVCFNNGFTCPAGFKPKNNCPLGIFDCVCDNGGFTCPTGFKPKNGCPANLFDCVCDNGGFECPVGLSSKSGCPIDESDCFCDNDGYTCPPSLTPKTSCPVSGDDCFCANDGYICPAPFQPTNSCPKRFSDCFCDAGACEAGTLTVTLNSQAGAYNGDLLAEITGTDAVPSIVTLVRNYDHNIGRTFSAPLPPGATVRVGITILHGRNIIWGNNRGAVKIANRFPGGAKLRFEDDGGHDFDDLILTASVTGNALLRLPDGEFESLGITKELLTNPGLVGSTVGWSLINPTGGRGPIFSRHAQGISTNSGDERAFGDGIEQTVGTIVGAPYVAFAEFTVNGGRHSTHTILVEILDGSGTVLNTLTKYISEHQRKVVFLPVTASSSTTTLRITNPFSTNSIGSDLVIRDASVAGLKPY